MCGDVEDNPLRKMLEAMITIDTINFSDAPLNQFITKLGQLFDCWGYNYIMSAIPWVYNVSWWRWCRMLFTSTERTLSVIKTSRSSQNSCKMFKYLDLYGWLSILKRSELQFALSEVMMFSYIEVPLESQGSLVCDIWRTQVKDNEWKSG